MNRFYFSIVAIFFSIHCFGFEITGIVRDRSGAPVSGAMMRFVNLYDVSKIYVTYTDKSGHYVVDESKLTFSSSTKHTKLFCYPNPFNRQTVISFHLDKSQHVELAIYNLSGQKMRVFFSGYLELGRNQIVWDGLSQQGTPLAPGLYVCGLHTLSGVTGTRLVILGGENTAVPVWPPDDPTETEIFNISISGKGFKTHHLYGIDLSGVSVKDFVIDRDVWAPFSITGDYLGTYNGIDYTPIFVKGVNIGSAVPGSWPGQLEVSSEQYARWFRMMTDAGFNTLRIYTLHFPRFYEEFAKYNQANPDKPLYLLHGVWLNEEFPNESFFDLHTLTNEFDKDIRDVIDCLHGNNTLSLRYGYAYGKYTTDISQWVLGYIVGREIHAYEIEETNLSKPNINAYSGKHLDISNATPSEAWATERLDKMIDYEITKYGVTRPVAFSSWLTLDPLDHPSAAPWYEDSEEVNLNKIEIKYAPGGVFMSYHAYPYYPNFISDDRKYQNVYDEMGRNPYLGLLRELRAHYTNYPVMIAEFGLPTSWGNARYSPTGMTHGGMTEEEQGKYTMRMFRNIYDTNYSGGVVFSWMDEWFKTTWITHPLTSSRRRLWHNIVSPENNYGLIHFVPTQNFYNNRTTENYNYIKISQASVWHDLAYFNVEVKFNSPVVEGDTVWIAFDTYKRDVGESTLPNKKRVLNNRAEFLARITADSAILYVTKAYNMQGLVFQNCYSPAFQTKTTDGEPWQRYKLQNDETHLRPNIQNIGNMNIYKGNGKPGIHHALHFKNDEFHLRIPWTLLHFSDPSNSMVVDDATAPKFCLDNWGCNAQYLRSISAKEGIAVTIVYENEVAEHNPYTWSTWNTGALDILNPNMFIEEEKESLKIIREGLKSTPFTPKSK